MVGLHEDRVALRQIHHEEPDLLLRAAQNRDGLAEIGLRVARRMREGHERLLAGLPAGADVIPHRGVAPVKSPLVAQPLEDPAHRVPLLARRRLVRVEDMVDESDMIGQLRPAHRHRPRVSRGLGVLHDLGYRAAVQTETPRRLAMAQPIPEDRKPHPCIEFHAVHPPPPDRRSDPEASQVAGFYAALPRPSRASTWPIIAPPFSLTKFQ